MRIKTKELIKGELAASAAGYPGAQNDAVTYVQYEMALNDPRFEDNLIKILSGDAKPMNNTDFEYCVWADGTWCHEEDLEEYLTFMSGDYYYVKECPDDQEAIT